MDTEPDVNWHLSLSPSVVTGDLTLERSRSVLAATLDRFRLVAAVQSVHSSAAVNPKARGLLSPAVKFMPVSVASPLIDASKFV